MAKKDTTFSDRDVVRIFVRELTKEEQENVRAWFLVNEIRKKNAEKGATLILKLAIFFLKSVPGFSLVLNLFLEGKDIFDDLLTEREALRRIQAADI